MASSTPTKGFRLNHIGLRVADMEKSIGFYSGVFGMQELLRMPLDTVTIVFLGYADAADSDLPVFARQGVLELVCAKNSSAALGETHNHPDSRGIKLGFSVPDMEKAMKYFKSHDIKVLKEAGTAKGSEVVASFLGSETPDKGLDKPLWEAAVAVHFVQDPDGYLVEIFPY
ncbi:Glyoxalase/Bleomycin resistance protein/Dihydroxybiphenyl dioxygenase [Plenodomus tracheiphilus IPT5]|uniref:Glyoxalase/Bleomycin resistance protein/Dihydroxybiphenyl dioxygenase n=1 Tax=Plenodomus tracheiphilus IPT5 TaxID=1408161 RepID=A0A6A7AQM0_9PLEO|nr:Glyoxalase/Bleomycin resistance protein/Dihydroxybiphenyl dioxygenase [Plenodomus tracheiphilus IPT5]